MKKSIVSIFAAVVVMASIASQAMAYKSECSFIVFSEVDMSTITMAQETWCQAYAAYLGAQEKGDIDAMKKSQYQMNESHAIAVAIRAPYGNYLEGINTSQYLKSDKSGVSYDSVITAKYQYDIAYESFKEGTISYEQMKLIQADALEIIEAIRAMVYEK